MLHPSFGQVAVDDALISALFLPVEANTNNQHPIPFHPITPNAILFPSYPALLICRELPSYMMPAPAASQQRQREGTPRLCIFKRFHM